MSQEQKILGKIDVSKIDKNKIIDREYTDKQGVKHIAKEWSFEMVRVKPENRKVVAEGDTWRMVKTHFVAEGQTEEERRKKAETKFMGDGLIFENKDEQQGEAEGNQDINLDSIPF